MSSPTVQGDQPLNDLEEARGSNAEASHPQPESDSPPNPTDTAFQAAQRTHQSLFPNSNSTAHPEIEKVIVLSFRSLQLQRITELQDELLKLTLRAAAGEASADQNENVDKALDNYAKALRNFETLSLNALPRVPRGATLVGSILSTEKAEPSLTTLEKLLLGLRKRLRLDSRLISLIESLAKIADAFPAYDYVITRLSLGWTGVSLVVGALASLETKTEITPSRLMEAIQEIVGNLGFRELDPLGREKRSKKTALTERLFMAMFGGVALIAPMLIMTLHPSRNVSLVTTSFATFIFALILAVGATNSAGKDVLAATAAYAAVLVVFFGTNTTGAS